MPTYAIIAHPVKHSLSPALHNAAFKAVGLKNTYKALDTPPGQLKERVEEMRINNYGGYSVSIPHKKEIIRYLDEIRGEALRIGAVNTVTNVAGQLIGDNTDYGGFKILLAEQNITRVSDKKAIVLGSGGAALAVITCLLDAGFTVLVAVRDMDKAKKQLENILISTDGTVVFMGFEDLTPKTGFDLLVNTTPIGMYPNSDESIIINPDFFNPERLFIDIVYNPVYTKMLIQAKKAGCRVATGDRMFLWQAVGQFELWTGIKAPVEIMEEELKSKLRQKLN